MTYKQIEASRELRLWIGQVIVPAVSVTAVVLANPDVRNAATGEVSVEYLIGLLSSEDVYASEQFVLDVDGLPCVLENELLYNALLSLPDSERKVILYDFWHDWKDKEISKKLEVTVRTVYNLRQRAFKKIRTYYELHGQGRDP
jgi:hypothetical protein